MSIFGHDKLDHDSFIEYIQLAMALVASFEMLRGQGLVCKRTYTLKYTRGMLDLTAPFFMDNN